MALAYTNPTDYRRINKLTRLAVKEGMSPSAVVKLWNQNRNKTPKSRAGYLKSPAKGTRASPGVRRKTVAYVLSGKAGKQSKARRSQYAKVRRQVAKMMGYKASQPARRKGRTKAGKKYARPRSRSYATRLLSQTKRARKAASRKSGGSARKSTARRSKAGTRKSTRGRKSNKGLSAWNKLRAANPGLDSEQLSSLYARTNKGGRVPRPVAKAMRAHIGGGRGYTAPRRSKGRRRNSKGQYVKGNPYYSGLALKNRRHGKRNPYYSGLALRNQGVFGALALKNPFSMQGVKRSGMDIAKLAGTGFAGAMVHAYVAPMIEDYLPEMVTDLSIPEFIAPIPVLGSLAGMNLVNTITGALAGGAIIILTNFAGRKLGIRALGKYGFIFGTGAIIAGPILDFTAHQSGDLGGLALDNDGVFGGLALDNEGVFGGLAYGDGMAYQLGPITSSGDYGQASLGDANYSGADFDTDEGQAIIEGSNSFYQKFGHPTVRLGAHGGANKGPSHLAGQKGHRWGWLVKMVGWENAKRLAALPPNTRVNVLRQMRQAALAQFNQMVQNADAGVLAQGELSNAPQGPDGAGGAYSSYGSTLVAGSAQP